MGRDLPRADRDIDATGLLVLPGGVDAHCHIEEPAYGGAELADDFDTATRAAACGGTTTIMPFVNLLAGATLRESVEDYAGRARVRSRTDYAFHLLLGEASAATIGQDLPALMEDGYRSVKVFMNYAGYRLDDDRILDVMEITRRRCGITMVHAENGHCVHWLSSRVERQSRPGLSAFEAGSPPAVEREATHRAITLSEISGARTLIVHVSAADAIEQIRWGQRAASRCWPKPARNTLSLPSKSSRGPVGKPRNSCARRPCGRVRMRRCCGPASATARCSWCRPTTAPTASKGARGSEAADRSRTFSRGECIWNRGALAASPGRGQPVERTPG